MIATASKIGTANALDRLLLISELLQRSSGPVCAGSLCLTLAERTNRPWSKRTVLRDLQLLRGRGYVEPIGGGKRGTTVTWQWIGAKPLLDRRPSA